MKNAVFAMTACLAALAACSDEAATTDAAPIEQGGEAVGDVEGGSISDAMIPLEALRSQSPTLRRQTTTVTTTSDEDGATSTTVETATVVTSGESEAPAPATPEPATPPRG